jgi:hypothetical protein
MWSCTTRLPGYCFCCVARWIPCFWGPVSDWFGECYIQIRKVTPEMFKVLQYTEVDNIFGLGALLLLGMEVTRECHTHIYIYIYIRKLMFEKFKVLLFTKTLKWITFLKCEHGCHRVRRWPGVWASIVTVCFLSYMDKRPCFLVVWAIHL